MPTTLGIGVALVRSCKGNEAIALLLTVGTNMMVGARMKFSRHWQGLAYTCAGWVVSCRG